MASWLVFQEQHRNIAALATNAMALDLAARGHKTPSEAIKMTPMSMEGAQAAADRVRGYLMRGKPLLDPNVPADEKSKETRAARKAELLIQAEVEIVKLWVESLRELEVIDEGVARHKEQHLLEQIRNRLYDIYDVPTEFRRLRVG